MHVVCPHCQNPIEIVADVGSSEILCPSCGSTFRLDAESTVSWRSVRGHRLGRFELIESVGSGAFGTVYKARDPQLDRIVAIKIPRSGNLAEREDLNRFLREGRSAAQLNHPTIVPVHEVGLSEGVPYLVSEFIEGLSLSDVLTARLLPPRESAELIAALADALHYAHERGIVHRDVKPSNVLFDEQGKPHLMDFGLAKRDAGEVTMTQDGQILGSPAYMSPEQAKGEAHRVDRRSDVYSLGVILYRLLSGELPFRGNTRMLLHQVLHDEPRSPRKLNDHIPRDLETICLKAMAKEPARRFSTAADLAADLRRYLGGETIRARPVSTFERAWRWAKRNRVVAALLATLAAVFVGGFTGVTLAWVRSEYFRGQAEWRRKEAVGQRQAADARRKAAEEAEQLAEDRRKQAEANFDQAIATVDEYLTKVGDEKLLDEPGLAPLRRDLLTSALDFYRRFLSERGDDPRLEPRVAAAYLRVAKIASTLGARDESREAARLAQDSYERLRKASPTDRAIRAGLASTLHWRGSDAEAVALWEDLVNEEPASVVYRGGLAQALNSRAIEQKTAKKHLEALQTYQRSLALCEAIARERPEDQRALKGLTYPYNNIGVLLAGLHRDEEALVQYQRAIEVSRQALRKNPRSYEVRQGLGLYLANMANALQLLGRNEDALRAHQEAIEVRQRLARDFAFVASTHRDLLTSYRRMILFYRSLHRETEAARASNLVRDYLSTLPRSTAEDCYDLACAASLCSAFGGEANAEKPRDPGTAAERARYADTALKALQAAVDRGFEKLDLLRNNRELDPIRNRSEFQALVSRLEQVQKANELAEQAGKLTGDARLHAERGAQAMRRQVLAKAPESPAHQRSMAANHQAIGVLQLELDQLDEAELSLREALALREALFRRDPTDSVAKAEMAATHIALGRVAWKSTKEDEAQASWAKGFNLLRAAYRDNPAIASVRGQLQRALFDVGHHYWDFNLTDLAAEYYSQGFACWAPNGASFWYRRALLFVVQGDLEGYRAFCKRFAEQFGSSDSKYEQFLVAVAASLGPSSGVPIPPDRLVSMAEGWRITRPNAANFNGFTALVNYRVGRDRDACQLARDALGLDPSWVTPALILALAHHRLGQEDDARFWLSRADSWWRTQPLLSLGRSRSTKEPVSSEDWTEAEALYDEAKRTLEPESYHGNPWLLLVSGRNNAWMGRWDKVEEAFAAAARLRPQDPRVWAERARIFAEFGRDDRAKADFDRAFQLGPADPDPHLIRAQVYARSGLASQAEGELAKVASFVPDQLDRFLDGGWWVVGPLPNELDDSREPEREADPSRPVPVNGSSGGAPIKSLSWYHVGRADPTGWIDDRQPFFPGNKGGSYYALAYVSVPKERSVEFALGSPAPWRFWVNRKMVHQSTESRDAYFNPDRVAVILRPGRNTLLLKVGLGSGRPGFFARVTDSDVDRGFAYAGQALWIEAGDSLERALEKLPALDLHLLRCLSSLRFYHGDETGYRKWRSIFETGAGKLEIPDINFWVGHTSIICRDSFSDVNRLLPLLEKGRQSSVQSQDPTTVTIHIALAHYRAGRAQEALRLIEPLGAENRGSLWLLLAMVHSRLSHVEEAHRWLEKAEEWYRQSLKDRVAHAAPAVGNWVDWGEFQLLLREAQESIRGAPSEIEPLQLLADAVARDHIGSVDRALTDCQNAMEIAPEEPLVWRKRSELLAKLGRQAESEADRTQAGVLAALANPGNPPADLLPSVVTLIDFRRSRARDHRAPPGLRLQLAGTLQALGELHSRLNQPDQALNALDEAGSLCKSLIRSDPKMMGASMILARAQLAQSKVFMQTGRKEAAIQSLAQARDTCDQLLRQSPNHAGALKLRSDLKLVVGDRH